jgi:hypothetical protein
MKKLKLMVACALALAFASAMTLRAAEEGIKQGKATVRSVHGTVEYLDNNAWLPVKPNMKFQAGVTIRTGPDGSADISVNGTASAVRLTNNTTLQIPTMSYVGTQREGDTTTMLNLQSGAILGNVKKITANSRYEIMTPHGVAGIRGTDYQVEAIPTSSGTFNVTFNSVTGVITVSAVINGVTVTHTLTTGMSWQIGDESPKQVSSQVEADFQGQILNMVQAIAPGATIGPVPGGNAPAPNNPNNPPPTANPQSTQPTTSTTQPPS